MLTTSDTARSPHIGFPARNDLTARAQRWIARARAEGTDAATLAFTSRLWLVTTLFIAGIVPLFLFGPFSIDRPMAWKMLFGFLATMGGSLVLLYRYRDPILGHLFAAFGCKTAIALAGIGYSYFAAALAMPLQDALFMRLDRMLGLDWTAHMQWLTAEPLALKLAAFGYSSLPVQSNLLVPVLVLTLQFHRLQTGLVAWLIAIMITLAVFALAPGVSTFAHLDIVEQMRAVLPVSGGYSHLDHFFAARAHAPLEIFKSMEGMIPMPSFHAASAVLFAWGFWSIRWLRWPAIALNALMIASTPVIGSHYFVDVIAGMGVATLSICVAQRVRAAYTVARTV